MKVKVIAAIALTALTIGFSAMNASAWGGGNGGHHMMGSGMMNGASYNTNVSQQTRDEINKIQIKMSADQAELTALMSSANPDSKRVRQLSESIATNQIALQEKYQSAGGGNGRMHNGYMMNNGYRNCMW